MKKPARSLQSKLIVSYLAIALLTVLVVSAFLWLTSGKFFLNLVLEQQTAILQQTVQDYYLTNRTLDGFFGYYVQFNRKDDSPPPPQDDYAPKPPSRDVRAIHGLVDADYRAILPTFGYEPGEIVPQDLVKNPISVSAEGQVIAWILPDTSLQFKLSAEEQLFLQRSALAVGLAALAGIGAALATGFVLAGRLLQPIRSLTQASQALARGDLNQQVPVTSQDELGILTHAFNQMSADLAQADEQRKRLTADITHDLSTPLQIISGYIEMLEGGEVTLSPQRIEIIKTELEHLRRLVGDLTTLSQAEGGGLEMTLQPVLPQTLLERVQRTYTPIAARQGVTLTLKAAPALPPLQADEGRMAQVLNNLLENALRYTPKGGEITLFARPAPAAGVELGVRDTGAGIDPEDLPYVFERFYRADKARGASGKMGLGLAICKALIHAQGGQIRAESEGAGKGASMVITLGAES